jgi:hypothetical protein
MNRRLKKHILVPRTNGGWDFVFDVDSSKTWYRQEDNIFHIVVVLFQKSRQFANDFIITVTPTSKVRNEWIYARVLKCMKRYDQQRKRKSEVRERKTKEWKKEDGTVLGPN